MPAILIQVLIPSIVFAWGGTGHRTVARIAEDHLSPQARVMVAQMLGGKALADVAVWADDIRNGPPYRQTSWYHTENIPTGSNYLTNLRNLSPAQQKMGGVVAALLVADAKLRDASTPLPGRIDALKFFVHFVGDIHQPLHTGPPEDIYGTQTKLAWMGQSSTLHEVWDTKLIVTGHADFFPPNAPQDFDASPAYAQWLERQSGRFSIDLSFDPELWIFEGLRLRPLAYDPRVKSDQPAYLRDRLPIVDQRIFAAGIRLSAELNRIAAGQPTGAASARLWATIAAIAGPPDQFISLRP